MRPDQVFTDEQLKQQGRPVTESALEKLGRWVQENHAQQPDLGAELRAMGREAVKDIRGKLMETFFGSQEMTTEPGVPLSPTPQMVTNELGTLGNYQSMLDTYAARGSVHGNEQDQGKGMEH
jgi:hypothetical protein